MTVWVVLLRGVNVGGANRLPMADFRASLGSLDYTDAVTYIQSGNAVFRSDDPEATVVRRVSRVLSDRHDLAVPVVARRSTELAGAVERHPFAGPEVDPKLLHVAFLDRAPDPGDLAAGPDADRWLPDRWAVHGRELYLAYPSGSGRSKMTIDRFERAWNVTATARNVRSLTKLVELAGTHP